ncbi:enkurin domain-containing protein 1-like [Corticium candelabrum]|uniref:enkurin domain-containing protein 1-like n=1 Tax=Corticium candelabrum TaxID=121492 RepID=UPI002E261C38|nr:enkurin domain-containing protein 1-like [Corticium candelabrum]
MASASTWTIPSARKPTARHPDEQVRLRTRPEAQAIADLHVRGTVHMLFSPVTRSQSTPRLTNPAVRKDHVRENVHRMREIQARSRQRQEEAAKPMKAMPQAGAGKYQHVESKVAQIIRRPASSRQRSYSVNAQSLDGIEERPGSAPPGRSLSAASDHMEVRGTKKNFVSENARSASRFRIRRSPSVEQLEKLKDKKKVEFESYARGKVPIYLSQRKKQWVKEAQERLANIPDPLCPAGHELMSSEQRLSTLAMLEQNKIDLLQRLRQLPVGSDTLRKRTQKAELENKLVEIDDAIKIFSRPKVFVKKEEE